MPRSVDIVTQYTQLKVQFLTALGLTLVSLFCNADDSLRFSHLTTDDGLPQSVVNTITQDRAGFIWFGTQSGLARYDGHQLLTYDHKTSSDRSHEWVWNLNGSFPDQLWFATDGGGLCSLDLVTENYNCVTQASHGLSSNSVRTLASAGDELWIGSEVGLDRVQRSTLAVTNIQIPLALSLKGIETLFADDAGNIWIGTRYGQLYEFMPMSQELRDHSSHVNARRIRAIKQDKQGNIWVATANRGLFRYANGDFTHYSSTSTTAGALPSNSLTALLIDQDQNLWIGTYSRGLVQFDPKTETFHQYRKSEGEARGPVDDHVVSLFQDSGGVIWVGTFSGVSRFNPTLAKFNNYSQSASHLGKLKSDYVTSFAEESSERFWVGTHKGIAKINLATKQVQTFSHQPTNPKSLADNKVFALAIDSIGGLWVGTMTGGLSHKPAGSTAFDTPLARSGVLPTGTGVTSLLVSQDQHLWVGTYNSGLVKVNPTTFTAQRYHPRLQNLPSSSVLALFQDRRGNLWVGTKDAGLIEMSAAGEVLNHYRHDPDNPQSLSSDVVFAVHETFAGDLWVGTASEGLNHWLAADRQNGRALFSHITKQDGLPDSTIHAILSEPDNTLWFSTNSGLVRLPANGAEPDVFNATHGLQHGEFNFAAAIRLSNGRMAFGGIRGFSLFDPEAVNTNPHPPKPALVNVTLNHKPVALTKIQDGTLTLEHSVNDIGIKFAALDYTAPHKNLYQYRLLGFDERWSEPSAHNRTNYTNLNPGRYTFQVRASNNDGVWSQSRLQLALNVEPAPWASTWAKILYAIVAIIFLLILRHYRNWRVESEITIRNKNLSLTREIERRHVQEQALLQQQEISQQYLDVVEVMIVVLDVRGRILLVNQKAERILGYRENELLSKDFYSVLIPSAVRGPLHAHIHGQSTNRYFEAPVTTKSGSQLTIAWNTTRPLATSQRLASGGGAHFICSGMDISHTRKLERRMSESQKMEALGGLARGIAHDFNNILSSILGYAELSRQDIEETSPATTNLKRLETSAIHARELVDSILAFSRQEEQNYERINVAAMVEQAMQLVEPVCPSNVVLNVTIADASAEIAAAPSQLLQVMTNLCTNAIQAMDEQGGMLSIEVATISEDLEFPNSAQHLVQLKVTDTGPGIAPDMQKRIFEPFYTTKTKDEGSGLGLAVVHGIVTQLGGTINVSSQSGSGTTFTLTLPGLVAEAPLIAQGIPPAPSDIDTPHATLLFVDNELTVLKIAEQMLTSIGYTFLGAASGSEALALLKDRDGDVDLVIADERMPHMLGSVLAERVRGLYPDLPIMLTSGSVMVISPYISSYLSKPFTQQELTNAVRNALHNESEIHVA